MSTSILPQRLRLGDRVALIAPAFQPSELQIVQGCERLRALGLEVDNQVLQQQHDGYFNGHAPVITNIIHDAFSNPSIKALISIRGGYGCARLLPLLDWELIRNHPKIVLGFSDLTALLIALHQRTGLVTFHGPSASIAWPQITQQSLYELLFEAATPCLQSQEDIKILQSGQATGVLIGGNLSVLTSLIGSGFLPEQWHDKILFLEDVHEEVYRLDRMLTQLKLAGILSQIKGLIFGRFNDCTHRIPQSFTVMELLSRVAAELTIPVLANLTFGHQPEMYTLPIGARVTLDADRGCVKFLDATVW